MLHLIGINKNTLRELAVLAIPMVVSQGAFAMMIFTDRLFMSQLGAAYLAAALGGGVASFFCLSFFTGVISYSNALAAQYLGAGKLSNCPKVVTQGLIITLIITPSLVPLTWGVGQLFTAMGHAPEQAALENSYFRVLMYGAVFTLAKTCVAAYFVGIGKTRAVMIADVSGVAINIPLSWMLIFGKLGMPELGIQGAALGTVIATAITLLIYAGFYFARQHREKFAVADSFIYDRSIMRRFLRLAVPSGLELFLNVAAFNLFLLMFQSYGIAESASAAIVFNWDMLSFVPMIGLNVSIIGLIGRYVGANNLSKANEVIRSGFLIGLSYSAILAITFISQREPLVDVFVGAGPHQFAIQELASFMMIGLASYVMADALILVSGGVLRGAGDTRWLMIVSIALHWAMLIGQFLVIRVFKLGPQISWMLFCAMVLSIAATYLWRLRGDQWRSPEAIRRVMAG